MRIERNEIRVFSAVVDEGSFSRAAERLNVSQSAVSQTIANLEHKLDALLLVRGNPTAPTDAGARLSSFCRTVINEEANTLEDLESIRSGALSTLNLAMNSTVNRLCGRELMLAFCESNPLTRLKLDVAPSREIVYGVAEDRWELGIGPFQRHMPGDLATTPYFEEVRILVVHENHPRFDALRSRPEDELKQLPLLTSYLDEAFRRPGDERLRNRFASVWEVSNFELRLALAEAGMGVTYLSSRIVDDYPGFAAIRAPEFASIPREVGLYYKKQKVLTEAAKRFVAVCQGFFRDRNFNA